MKLIGDKVPPAVPEFKSMTVRWPVKSNVPAISGKWKHLPDGRVEAIYTASELAICLLIAEIICEQNSLE